MSWWAVGPAGASSASGTQQAASRNAAEQDAQAYGEVVLAGPFATQAAAQGWTAGTPAGGTSGGGTWWVVPVPGGIARTGPSASALYQAVQAASRPAGTVAGPFSTQAAAEAWISAKDKSPITVPSPLTGLNAIGDFFNKLGEANTWIRVGEVLLGVVLIAVGVARITGAQNVISQVVKARIP